MVTRLLQSINALSLMVITDAGRVMLVRLMQPKKAASPIVTRELFAAKVIVVILKQASNAPIPMLVTLLGIVILVRFLQLTKALSLIVITDPGILKEPAFALGQLINSD